MWQSITLAGMLVAVAATDGLLSCPCLSSWNQTAYLTSGGIAATHPGAGIFVYPQEYGATRCAAHDKGLDPLCSVDSPPTWCSQNWVCCCPAPTRDVHSCAAKHPRIPEPFLVPLALARSATSTAPRAMSAMPRA